MKYFIIALAIAIFALWPKEAAADHGVVRCGGVGQKACITVTSRFVERVVKPGQELTWCVNPRAANYPDFRNQLEQVFNGMAEQLRLAGARQVAYPLNPADMSCVVRNDMPEKHGCSGCAAWVYTDNLPILIEYNWETGITFWFSTDGHELGHALCLLDEHYDKVNFRSWILYYGYWQHGLPTVMDVGTPNLTEYRPYGIFLFTDYDLARCSETLGRDLLAPPPCGEPCYDAATNSFRFASGWVWFKPTEVWLDQYGRVAFEARNAAGWRYSPITGGWHKSAEHYARGEWGEITIP